MAETWQILIGVPLAVVGEVVFDGGVTTYRSLAPHGDYVLRTVRDIVMSKETYVFLPDGRAAGGPHDTDAARLSQALARVNGQFLIEVRGRLEIPQPPPPPPSPPPDPDAKAAIRDALLGALANVRLAKRAKVEARVRAVADAVMRATTSHQVLLALHRSFEGVPHDDPIVEVLIPATATMMEAIPGPVVGGHPLRLVIENFDAAFTSWQVTPPIRVW
jgi:hypothetical protein